WGTRCAAASVRSRRAVSSSWGSTWTTTSLSGSASCTAASTASAAAWPWPTAAPGGTPMTTSANCLPPAWRIRRRRSCTGGSSAPIAREGKQRIPLRVHRSRRQPGQVRNGPPADEDGGDDKDRGLGQRRQMLRLPVTIGVAGIGGPPRDADREEREERRDEVDAGVRRLREQ